MRHIEPLYANTAQAMMQNPAMIQQAMKVTQNPAMMKNAMAMMGGGGGGWDNDFS